MTLSDDQAMGRPGGGETIVATAGSYYRNMRYLMSAVIVGMGLWFAYDGWYAYPKQNIEFHEKKALVAELVTKRTALEGSTDPAEKATYETLTDEHAKVSAELKELKEHTSTDLLIQRGLGFVLPPAGLAMLGWALYNSRGKVRLANEVLEVPGHPAIPLGSVTSLDNTLWDRKGIAYVHYDVGGKQGKARLDDFVYDRKPVDAIYDAIRLKLAGPEGAVVEGGTQDGGQAAV